MTLIALLPLAFSAAAQNAPAKGDPAAGAVKAETCFGCHAAPNYFNVYPSYHVPKLGGQRPEYIVEALKAYQDGLRDHGTMQANAGNLSEQDMQDIAAYLASMPRVNVATDAAAPADLDKLAICTTCHGPAGISAMAPVPGSIVPHLAGQYADYMAKALRDYRSGDRQHAVMQGMAAGLTDAEIDSLSAYYAGRQGLTVVQKP
ncbi:MAG TPA: c-type cytochrome [Gammaproteobacteria bacterium]